MINFAIFFCTLAVATVIYVRHKYAFWANKNVNFIKPSFPYGNLQGMGKTLNLYEITQKFYNKTKGSEFIAIYFFINPSVVVCNLDFVKTMLVKDFQFFHDRGLYHNERDDPLTAHLFSIEGQKWKNLRSKLTPTFTSGKMKFMFPTIVKIGEEFKQTMSLSVKENPEIEMRDIIARFTTDVIGSCAFGLDCNSLKDPEAEFRKNGRKVFETPRNPIKSFFTNQFQSLSKNLHLTIFPKDVSVFFMKAVKDTIAYREEHNVKRNDFMDLLIEMKNSKDVTNTLTIEEIAAQAFIFFLAGFETSSTAMSFALYELALNQKTQNKARECVQDVLKKHNGELTYDSMMEMTYITQCINESLRKYPPVTNLIRCVTKDYKVPDSEVVFNKGVSVIIPVYAIHHDPLLYKDPEVYDPERFTPENTAARNPYAFLPFGEGPRNCIGLRFGMMQARIGLAVLLSNFKFEISNKTSVPLELSKSSSILTPTGGIWLKVTIV